MSVLHLLNAAGGATQLRDAATRLPGGQFPQNFLPLATFPVRRPFAPSGREMELARRMETNVTHITYTEPGRDIQRGDRLVIEGLTYDVTAVLPPSKPHHLKVLLERREHGATQ